MFHFPAQTARKEASRYIAMLRDIRLHRTLTALLATPQRHSVTLRASSTIYDLPPLPRIMNTEEILAAAQARGKQMGLPYAGALTPAEAHTLMTQHANAKLVDVRTRAEWDWVGRVPDAVEVEIMSYPSRPNPNFMQELQQDVAKDAVVMFLCRSGAR